MMNEIDALERKVALVVGLCADLRAENVQLRQQLAAAESERRNMTELMSIARTRIEQLAQQLPESKTPDQS